MFSSQTKHVGSFAVRSLLAISLAVWMLAFSTAQGQDEAPSTAYKIIRIYPDYDVRMPPGLTRDSDRAAYTAAIKKKSAANSKRNEIKKIVMPMLMGLQPIDDRFDKWFELIVFAEMTQTDEQSLRDMPKRRQQFFREYLHRNGISQQAHDHLVNLTGTKMREICKDSYHPAVRHNAMLIIGDLNMNEAISFGGTPSPPIPFVKALRTVLLAEFASPDQIDAVKVAALVGILRHAKIDGQFAADRRKVPVPDRVAVIDEMVKLIRQKEPPPNRSEAGHRWMQRRAIEVLGAFRDVGAGNVVANQLRTVIEDTSEPLESRCIAAVAFGNLNFPKPKEADIAGAVRSTAALTASACHQELDRLEKEWHKVSEAAARVGGGRVALPARAPTAAEVAKHKMFATRRLLKYYILCAQRAIGKDEQSPTGLWRYSTAEPAKSYVPLVAGTLNVLMKSTDGDKKGDKLTAEMLISRMRSNLRELDKLADTGKPKNEPPKGLPGGPGPEDGPAPLPGEGKGGEPPLPGGKDDEPALPGGPEGPGP